MLDAYPQRYVRCILVHLSAVDLFVGAVMNSLRGLVASSAFNNNASSPIRLACALKSFAVRL